MTELYLSVGCLAATHSKYAHKLDFPGPDWPYVSFPKYKYPLEDHQVENANEDKKILSQVQISTAYRCHP